MAKISKSMRIEEELIELIEKKGEGKDFTDKLHNALSFHFTEEDKIKARIKKLEQKERELQNQIAGLESITNLSKSLFLKAGNLLEAVGRRNEYHIDNTMEDLNKIVTSIKKTL